MSKGTKEYKRIGTIYPCPFLDIHAHFRSRTLFCSIPPNHLPHDESTALDQIRRFLQFQRKDALILPDVPELLDQGQKWPACPF